MCTYSACSSPFLNDGYFASISEKFDVVSVCQFAINPYYSMETCLINTILQLRLRRDARKL